MPKRSRKQKEIVEDKVKNEKKPPKKIKKLNKKQMIDDNSQRTIRKSPRKNRGKSQERKNVKKPTEKNNKNNKIKNNNNEFEYKDIPIEIWVEIIKYFPSIELIFNFSHTCRYFYQICENNPIIWQRFVLKDDFLIKNSVDHYLIDQHNERVNQMIEKGQYKNLFLDKMVENNNNICFLCDKWSGFSEVKETCLGCYFKKIYWPKAMIIHDNTTKYSHLFGGRKSINKNYPSTQSIIQSIFDRFEDFSIFRKYSEILWEIVSMTNIYYFPVLQLEKLCPQLSKEAKKFRKIFFDEKMATYKKKNAAINYVNRYRSELYLNAMERSKFPEKIKEKIKEELAKKGTKCWNVLNEFKTFQHYSEEELIQNLVEVILEEVTPKEIVDHFIKIIVPILKGKKTNLDYYLNLELHRSRVEYLPMILPESFTFLCNSYLENDWNVEKINFNLLISQTTAIKKIFKNIYTSDRKFIALNCRLMRSPHSVDPFLIGDEEFEKAIKEEWEVRESLSRAFYYKPKRKPDYSRERARCSYSYTLKHYGSFRT